MQIQSLLIRQGGTRVDLDDARYHFKPISNERDAPHVASVLIPAHQDRLLAITEGYCIYKSPVPARSIAQARAPKPITPPPAPPLAQDHPDHPANVATAAAPADEGTDDEGADDQDADDEGADDATADQGEADGADRKAATLTDAARAQMVEELGELSDEALAAEYKAHYARPPMKNWKRDTIITRIIDAP